MTKPALRPQNNHSLIPGITEEDIARLSAAIGVNGRRYAPVLGKHIASPQRYEDKPEARPICSMRWRWRGVDLAPRNSKASDRFRLYTSLKEKPAAVSAEQAA